MVMKCGSGYIAIYDGKVIASGETALECKAKADIAKKESKQNELRCIHG